MALASYRASGIVRLVRHSQQRPAGEVDSSRRFRRLVFARLEVFSFSFLFFWREERDSTDVLDTSHRICQSLPKKKNLSYLYCS